MRLPRWGELHQEQRSVLDRPLDKSLFVAGPPGSGKTSLAVRRAHMCARRPGEVCIVTYNRMLRRLLLLLDHESSRDSGAFDDSGTERSAVTVLTMDQFVGDDWRRRFPGEDFRDFPSSLPDWDTRLERLAGEALRQRWGHIVVDEGQDLPQWFFRYAALVSDATAVFADEEQAIRSKRSTLEEIKQAANLSDPMILTKNHRNTPEIARVAEHFHAGRLPAATVVRSPGDQPRLVRLDGPSSTAHFVARWFNIRGGSVGVIARQNDTVATLQQEIAVRLPRAPVRAYTHGSRNEDEIDVTVPGVTVLNVRSAKGQEFDTVVVSELERFLPCSAEEKRWMYMLCTRARHRLFLIQHQTNPLEQVERALPGPEVLLRP